MLGGGGTLIRYQPHPLSRLPFHAFNVVLVSCGHFRSHFGQNVISSLSMPMVSNRPYSFLVIVFTPEVIGRRGCWRGTRKTIISFCLVRSYNKTMDGLVIKKKFVLSFWKKKKIVLSLGQKKKIVLRGKNPDPPLVMKWEAPKSYMACYFISWHRTLCDIEWRFLQPLVFFWFMATFCNYIIIDTLIIKSNLYIYFCSLFIYR